MNFLVINPWRCSIKDVDGEENLEAAYAEAGLKRGQVDFATLHRNPANGTTINIIVYEYGLFKPPAEGRYFSLGNQLYEGGAVLFAADEEGNTISYPKESKPPVTFYGSANDVEAAIARGEIQRPRSSVNGAIVWEWPGNNPRTGKGHA
jgi:hypothetical protein